MSTKDPKAQQCLARFQRAVAKRSPLDGDLQEIKELVRPNTSDFYSSSTRPGDAARRIFDSTAPWSLDQLASGLHTNLSSPVDQWFMLGVTGTPFSELDFETKAWLELASDIIYSHYSNPSATFNPAFHEVYLDVGGFGTGCVYQWYDPEDGVLMFKSYPLADIWIDENNKGLVDTVYRSFKWTILQCRQEWDSLPEEMNKLKDDETVTLVYEVMPRKSRDTASRGAKHKKIAALYVCRDTGEIVHESGFDFFPYHVPRWSRVSGELYGRSPALNVMPDIRMVNAMRRTVIVAAQKMVDPPLMVEDDGYILPVRTTPGSLTFRRPGAEPIIAMPTAQRIEITTDQINQSREMITRGFYVDWLLRPTKKERQTAEEIRDDRMQMLQQLGPVVGRQQAELLGPCVALSYNLLNRAGKIPPPPPQLDGVKLEIAYISPAARAQALARGQGMLSYLSQITQLLPVMPGLIYSINEDALNAELQDLTDAPRRVLLPPAAAKQRREDAEQQQQMAQAAELAPKAAKATLDVAKAREIDPGITES